jgi:LuxR family transcriptional regulator, quorum-sensing system regulator SolR
MVNRQDVHDDAAWWPEVFHDLAEATSAQDAFHRACRFIERLGFSFCSFGVRFPTSVASPSIAVLDSYPAGWMEDYTKQNYVRVDPTVALGATLDEAIVWTDHLFARAPDLWSDAKTAGLRVGVAQSSWGASGAFGLLSIAREAGPLSDVEIDWLRPRLRWLADNAHPRMQTCLAHGAGLNFSARLTSREHDVMSWTAEGKTSWEVAQILTISESTVNFHIKNAIAKLNAKNKVHAAVKASSLGLLFGETADSVTYQS